MAGPERTIGIDVGTSGVRACALDADGEVRGETRHELPEPATGAEGAEQDPELWWRALTATLTELAEQLGDASVTGLALDGTSGTLLLTDATGQPLGPAWLYNDRRARAAATTIAAAGPAESGAHGPTSGLAKLLHRHRDGETAAATHALHAADWLTGRLLGRFGVSDANNALKLGYDPQAGVWPDWVRELVPERLLPTVVAPGTPLGGLSPTAAAELELPDWTGVPVCAGTTDSIAAFLATGAGAPGEAVTSLGSTLVLKVVSPTPVYAPANGIYSHRLGELWLAGGASNTGGAVLRQHFSDAEMTELTPRLDPERPTGLDYVPLPATGERFPEADPDRAPRLEPRPADPATFFQGILEAIADTEARGYRRLAELGAPYPVSVRTVGGGAANPAWTRLREQRLGVPLVPPRQQEAACGAALLARGEGPTPGL